jgi:hypothetical protein
MSMDRSISTSKFLSSPNPMVSLLLRCQRRVQDAGVASRQPIILTDEIVPPPALIRAGMDALPSIIRAQGERASRRFIEFFTANICNRNTRMAYALAVRQFFDWCEQRGLALDGIRPRTVAAYIEQMRRRLRSRRLRQHLAAIRQLFDYWSRAESCRRTPRVRCTDPNMWLSCSRFENAPGSRPGAK